MPRFFKCTICGREFNEEEAEYRIVKHDERTGYCECEECAEKLLAEHARQKQIRAATSDGKDEKTRENSSSIKERTVVGAMAERFKEIVSSQSPEKIKAHLDEYVIGQDEAKETLAVAVYNHYKRLTYSMMLRAKKLAGEDIGKGAPTELAKSNVIMVGPSGTGKTYLLETIAKYLDVPFAVTDTSTLTEAGYVGQDPETCIKNIYLAAGKDIQRAETGIVFLDEFDKIARKNGNNRSITADPGHEGVQQALLKIIEGTMVSFQEGYGRRNPDSPGIYVDTSNILFVVGGAFEGIEKSIAKRISKSAGMGLDSEDSTGIDEIDDDIDRYNALIDHIEVDDIKSYGIIPEMMGRLPILCRLHQLKKEDLVHIMTQPRNAIFKQMQILFRMDGCGISFSRDAAEEIAERALRTGTGARALKTIIEGMLLKTMYRLPSMQFSKEGYIPVVQVTRNAMENGDFPIAYTKKTA